MYFLDLEDLKIIKSYKFENVGVAGNIDIMNSNLLELKNHFDTQTDILFASVNNAIETCFYYYIPYLSVSFPAKISAILLQASPSP